MKNYSRQREVIFQVLKGMHTHPTAASVYEKAKEILPCISLGTVYRNLALLRDRGQIVSLSVGDGFERFDGDTTPHLHLHCQCCKGLCDLTLTHDPVARLARDTGFAPKSGVYILYGICADCRASQNETQNQEQHNGGNVS